MKTLLIDGNSLDSRLAKEIVDNGCNIAISSKAMKNVIKSRKIVENWIKKNEVIYGVTTGFGEFKDVFIPQKDLEKLQKNLLRSHAAGVGECLPKNIIRLMLLLRINSLAKGYSGVRLELVNYLVKLFNKKIVPYVPSKGSVGSSGDLAPLAHLTSFIFEEGFGYFGNELLPAKNILVKARLKPFSLEAKEGLALINGTQMMAAFGVEIIERVKYLSKLTDIAGALSHEALRGSQKAYKDELQKLRPHRGQIKTADNLRKLLKGSEINLSHVDCDKVQDSYSLRCIPQVHGAVKDTIEFVDKTINIEINSATDNPLIFPVSKNESARHIEGGNFHGEPLALGLDYLKIALSEFGNISERRTARLVDGSLSDLPRFLTSQGGLNSGLMIAQYTAAALASENKILSHPASVDTIPTSANQEDHNSMGSISARKCYEVLNNVEKIIAIEVLCAVQGIDFLRPLRCGKGTETAYNLIRAKIPHIEDDVYLSEYIEKTCDIIFDHNFIKKIESVIGMLS
jgi:histidine ammonia-lyase